jgi:hypothetical protein
MLVRLENAPNGSPNSCFALYDAESGVELQFVQTDWGYPGLASSLGWRPCEHCTYTDGTVDCDHNKASAMIASAFDWLYERDGETFDVAWEG